MRVRRPLLTRLNEEIDKSPARRYVVYDRNTENGKNPAEYFVSFSPEKLGRMTMRILTSSKDPGDAHVNAHRNRMDGEKHGHRKWADCSSSSERDTGGGELTSPQSRGGIIRPGGDRVGQTREPDFPRGS